MHFSLKSNWPTLSFLWMRKKSNKYSENRHFRLTTKWVLTFCVIVKKKKKKKTQNEIYFWSQKMRYGKEKHAKFYPYLIKAFPQLIKCVPPSFPIPHFGDKEQFTLCACSFCNYLIWVASLQRNVEESTKNLRYVKNCWEEITVLTFNITFLSALPTINHYLPPSLCSWLDDILVKI